MKIKYEFADETIEIEVDENWGAVLIELDRQEYNNDHAETRRHISLETALEDENNSWLTDNSDTELDALQNVDFARLRAAMQLLEPRQQQLIRQIYSSAKKRINLILVLTIQSCPRVELGWKRVFGMTCMLFTNVFRLLEPPTEMKGA